MICYLKVEEMKIKKEKNRMGLVRKKRKRGGRVHISHILARAALCQLTYSTALLPNQIEDILIFGKLNK